MKTEIDLRRCMRAGVLAVSLLSIALSACTTTKPPEPAQMSRTVVETAPADLQLLCADAVKQAGGAGAKALPISSRRLDAKTFQVDFDGGGAMTTCIIDAAGNVVSVKPAAA